ncbi:DUF423 domain-containing protein [Leptospira levettii]|uniref:DUF423 domain-containing protein n=1 Tax=Leptospira levettii TaxID=2023178 RepID=A0ABY2MSG4_9LEPT|nr:DUF423 domain-containing protein [Leptospira levettii]MCW7496411.1 DUF423 domain-containing protein [Leptospira levettii]TGL16371.1 DUF423 domain-containing protein [Leptospira levettii]TGL74305.1 DUF423 domain-containing protein [Leptospira levettii]TGM29692.1 DUF423 domain-containing protein [Leptospira levettii]TGM44698.1 DUF423 domain-containing protein [Leptospira levettii]
MKLVKKQSDLVLILLICLAGFLAVAIGAFGAHGLKKIISADLMITFETGNKYHFYHSITALFAFLMLILSEQNETSEKSNKYLRLSIWMFLTGILIFSFSLYFLAITGLKILGAITPFGGVSFLAGWLCLGLGMYYFLVPKK